MTSELPPARILDVRGFLCPIPALEAQKAVAELAAGEVLQVEGDDPVMVIDIPAWCDEKGHAFLGCERDEEGVVRCRVEKGADPHPPG